MERETDGETEISALKRAASQKYHSNDTEHQELKNRRLSLTYMHQGEWLKIQTSAFRNWVNEQLRPSGAEVKDLRMDFTDGVNLVALVEVLTSRSVSGARPTPTNHYQVLQNITAALETVAKDGVKIINIDSQAVAEGNLKLILGLIWLLILNYQGGLGVAQHRKWMLAWLRAILPKDVSVGNFTTDWNDGRVLHALLEFCQPGIAPDWRSLDKEDRLNNCRQAMELAKQQFDIPLVLTAEDLSSPLLDEKSALLYLSYFTRVGGPAYNATRDRIQEKIASREITNFTSDWHDGVAFADLVSSCGGHIPHGSPFLNGSQSDGSSPALWSAALEASRALGIEPLLTVEEIQAQDKEHMGIMALTAQFLNRVPAQPPTPPPEASIGTSSHSTFDGLEFDSAHNTQHEDLFHYGFIPEKVTLLDDDVNSTNHTTNASSSAESSGVGSLSLHHHDQQQHHQLQQQHHQLQQQQRQQKDGSFQLVRRSSIKPFPEAQTASSSSDSAFRIDIYSVGVIMEREITGRRFDPDLFKVEAEAPSGRVIRMAGDGHYSAQFTPDEIGRWRVSMYYNGHFMDGCPVDVCDPSQVRVRGLRGGHVGKQQTFQVDCTGAGQGDLGVDITHHGRRVPAHVTETLTPRLFKVAYTPYDPGPYEVNVHFNRAEVRDSDFHSTDPEERRRQAVFKAHVEDDQGVIKINVTCDWEIDYVTGGPFVVHVTDSSDILVYGMKDGTVCNNPELIADCSKVGEGTLTAEVTYQGVRFPCKVRRDSDRHELHRVSFTPRGPGLYKIWMEFDGRSVKGSPFLQEIAALDKPRAYGDGLYRGLVDKTHSFTLDPKGHPGGFTATVTGPSRDVTCHLTPQSDGTLLGTYVAKETGSHVVDIRLQGKPIEGSPFKPYIVDPHRVHPTRDWISLVSSGDVIPLHVNREKSLPFDASEAGLGELSAEVRGPSGRIPVAIDSRNDARHTLIFTPREEGKHYIDVKWGGFPLPHSPFQGYATWVQEPRVISPPLMDEIITLREIPLHSSKSHVIPVQKEKDIIPLTVGQKKELTFDTAESGHGTLTAAVRGPIGFLPVAVNAGKPGFSKVIFTPQEEGKHLIDVNWNGTPMAASPFIGYAVDEPGPTKQTGHAASVYLQTGHAASVYLHGHGPPLGKMREEEKEIIALTVGREKQLPFDASKAGPGQLTATVQGPSHTVPCSVLGGGDGTPVVRFTPDEEGKHKIEVSWNGVPLLQSPLLGYASLEPLMNGYPRDSSRPSVYLLSNTHKGRDGSSSGQRVHKNVLPLQVNKPVSLPFDASTALPGQLAASIRGPTKAIPATVEDSRTSRPILKFVPEEEGKHEILVTWNARPIPESPVIGLAVAAANPQSLNNGVPPVYLAGYHPRLGRTYHPEKDMIPLKVNHPKLLPFDSSDAGPGLMTAKIRGPTHNIPVHVEDRKRGNPTLHFVPEEEGRHLIEVEWNGLPVPKSPFMGYASRESGPVLILPSHDDPDVSFRSSVHSQVLAKENEMPAGRSKGPAKVILSGRGLKEAVVEQPAVFHVDGTQAMPGVPTGHLEGTNTNIPVYVENLRPQVFKCSYVPEVPGAYKLYVRWNDQPLKGSPFNVKVKGSKNPSLAKGIIYPYPYNKSISNSSSHLKPGEDFELKLDHPDPSQLTVTCRDPRGEVIPCRFYDNMDGTHSLKMTPTMPGRHVVEIRQDNHHVMGSPYYVDISDSHVQGRVRVWGPGIQRGGLLPHFHSNFWVDTTGAGAGELRVRIMGPKGAFHVTMCKAKQREKLYQCFYDPTEAGIYTVDVQWSGQHVPGSPFTVALANSQQELELIADLSSGGGGSGDKDYLQHPHRHDASLHSLALPRDETGGGGGSGVGVGGQEFLY